MSVVTREPPSFENEKLYLMARLADDLAPNLSDRPQDRRQAVPMAWRTIQSLHPGSEIEAIAAARIAALSFVQLDLLRDATQANLTPAMKLRYASAVTRLNRAICDSETALARRQKAEELRPAIEQAAQPDRINRASNAEAIEQAKVAAMYGEIDLIRALKRQEAMAMAAMAAEADKPTPSADPAVHGAATAVYPAPAAAPAHPTPATAAHPAPAPRAMPSDAPAARPSAAARQPEQSALGHPAAVTHVPVAPAAADGSSRAAAAASLATRSTAAPDGGKSAQAVPAPAAGSPVRANGAASSSTPAPGPNLAASTLGADLMARVLAACDQEFATFYPSPADPPLDTGSRPAQVRSAAARPPSA